MFTKILIANRGEIACRVIKTARSLGIGTVAVYSDVDADALHVRMADEAVHIGGAAPSESYLKADVILEACKRTGAQAVHPGYGFLSENAGFAEACEKAGVVFIGPPAPAIVSMGSKAEAKAIMSKADVPVVPGYHGENQDPAFLKAEADKTGYPLLIKASAGGGGKGMRLVTKPEDFEEALGMCQRESRKSFGDDRVLLERFITRPRHIEIQVFADSHGEAVYLFERDCSIQRRHQKVVEEAPAPMMDPAMRERMGVAAVNAAKAVGYVGAGTVEFIAESDDAGNLRDFFFMEMNTRLQVEHPVTELITGQDLVEWQLRVASGRRLPLTQDQLAIKGHAIETRLYAEDPDQNYMPSTGRLFHVGFPEEGPGRRIDTGVVTGSEVTSNYDPMIAKVISWGRDREQALANQALMLSQTAIGGVKTNRDFLLRTVRHPLVAKGGMSTAFLEGPGADILEKQEVLTLRRKALIVAAEILNRRMDAGDGPWTQADFWRMNIQETYRLRYMLDGEVIELAYRPTGADLITLEEEGDEVTAKLLGYDGKYLRVEMDGMIYGVTAVWDGSSLLLADKDVSINLVEVSLTSADGAGGAEDALSVAMAGTVVAVKVKPGDTVKQGDTLLIVEAMKIEHAVMAPKDGVIAEIYVAEGEMADEGVPLAAYAEEEGE